jgi:hypothetical protein
MLQFGQKSLPSSEAVNPSSEIQPAFFAMYLASAPFSNLSIEERAARIAFHLDSHDI